MEERVLSVTELNTFIKRNLESNENFKNVHVTGELSNLTFNKSGHIYFSIKDEGSSISCMIWKDKAIILKSLNPKEGMKLTVVGRVTYYVPNGKTNFEVVDVQLDGVGQLHLLFNQRKEQLENLGWFDKSLKKPIPQFPKNIGIVTASTGAAVQDLIKTILRRYPQVNLYVFPTLVQGEQAQFDIANKIKQANNFEINLDTLIVGRGGGSYEDLWSFNEMPVLEAIKDSNIPIISAVGHEPDFTLADYVADVRAATPTAAGEISTPSNEELKRALQNYELQIYKSIIKKHNDLKKELKNYYMMTNKSFNFKMNEYEKNFKNVVSNLNHLINAKINGINDFLNTVQKQQINKIKDKINLSAINLKHLHEKALLLNPLKPLEKGFALLTTSDKKILKTIEELKNQKEVIIEMKDGKLRTELQSFQEEK